MRDYLLTLLVAAAVTYVLTPLVRRFATMIGAIKVEIRERDVHTAPVPLIGGLAMYAGLAAALLVANQIRQLHESIANTGMVAGLLAGGGLLVIIGVIDDRWGMSALTKAAGQVAAAGIVVATGTQLSWLPLPGGNGRIFVPTPDQQTLLTILIIVATINAVNFIDGLDGLAAGIVAIAATSFFAYYYSLTRLADISSLAAPALASAVLIGMCLGFLPHNFAPAKIFMGDTGSMLLGLMLAYAPISSINSLDPAQLTDSINRYPVIMPLLLPALLLVIPYGDMLLAVVRRTRAGQSPFAADRKHLHHRLLDIGHSQRASVLIMYLWAAAFSGTVVWFSITKTEVKQSGTQHRGEPVIVFVVITVVAVAILVLLSMPWRHWGERARDRKSPATAGTASAPAVAVGATAQQSLRSEEPDLVATGAAARPAEVGSPRWSPAGQHRSAERGVDSVPNGNGQPADTQAHDAGSADRWDGDGADAGHGLYAAEPWAGDGADADGLYGADQWPDGAADPGHQRPEADWWSQAAAGSGNGLSGGDRWQGGDDVPGNGLYESDRPLWNDADDDTGWPWHEGRSADFDAGGRDEAGADRADDQQDTRAEPPDHGLGSSIVGTVPPASDWSWFGSAAGNRDPGTGRDL